MNDPKETGPGALAHGLPMVTAQDGDALAQEKAELAALEQQPLGSRLSRYMSRTGPGWLQSAMTLGGGSAVASLTMGALYGYRLLWVQPLAMLLGVLMLSAVSHQSLSTGARHYGAMKVYVHPVVAWAWAWCTLLATLIWHFPQYALAAGMLEDMIKTGTGFAPSGGMHTAYLLCMGLAILVLSTAITWNYGKGRRGIRLYERGLKGLVWLIILAFLAVILHGTLAGRIAWGQVVKGCLPLYIPTDSRGAATVLGAFGAAVGINMTFLFPYTLLARGWGREHRTLAKFDLLSGMLIPYAIATGLIVVAAAATLHGTLPDGAKSISPVAAAGMFTQAGMGEAFAHYVFGLGILGMALSTITLHMLVNGFALCEILGIEPVGWKYRLACLTPAPGVLGVVLWSRMGSWVAIPTSAACAIMLPVAYIGFFCLHNRPDFLGADMPRGRRRSAWNVAMLLAIVAAAASTVYAFANQGTWSPAMRWGMIFLFLAICVGLFVAGLRRRAGARTGRSL
ncbi:MAG: divalent metal cation transporter [Lentisphaeria bacterium]|nr:divalent metal cation transporter [Lentisphaeria bacterium]